MYEMKHMRIMSVARMKNRKLPILNDCPAEGSVIRAVWDRLQAHKGSFISMNDLRGSQRLCHIRIHLTDIWGLDIAYKPKGIWCLIGEWKGKEYVDYLAEKYK